MECRQVSIRAACPAVDATGLLDIYAYYVENTAITFEYAVPDTLEFEQRIKTTLGSYPWLVAELSGHLVGYAYAGRFKARDAYAWAVETSIYVQHGCRQSGLGRCLYAALENVLRRQHVLNCNACITWSETEDARLTHGSVRFHEKAGYAMVGTFRRCGYKFDKWYDMLWMEKHIGDHVAPPATFVPFRDLPEDEVRRLVLECRGKSARTVARTAEDRKTY